MASRAEAAGAAYLRMPNPPRTSGPPCFRAPAPRSRRPAAFLPLAVLTLGAAPVAAQPVAPNAAATAPPAQAPTSLTALNHTAAPYVPPAVGTRYVYTSFAQTITANDGLRTRFVDHRNLSGERLALFIPQNPATPLIVDSAAVARIWPLRVGREARVATARGPLQWEWRLRVVGTERVRVPAGTFDTYVVEAVEVATRTANPTAAPQVTTFWYAPANGAVVRFSIGILGRAVRRVTQQELVRVEPPAKAGPGTEAPRRSASVRLRPGSPGVAPEPLRDQ